MALDKPKLRNLSDAEFKNVMLYMYAVVGLRGQNFPAGMEKEFLHTFIRTNYGGHSADEVRLAFDMAIQGQLDLDPKDVKCYENFSIAYFTIIMNAYRKWARDEFKRIERTLPPPPLTPAQLLDKKMEEVYYRYSFINKQPAQWPRVNLKIK